MKRRSHAKRVDANQAEIIEALKAIGCSVLVIEEPVDLLVGHRNVTFLLEVKNPEGFDTLTGKQIQFIETWRGSPVYVVRSVEEAVNAVRTEKTG